MSEHNLTLCEPTRLAELMREGNLEALDRLSRCYGQRMLQMGRRRCGDDDKAQDAVQDALESAGRNLAAFRGEGSVEGWLLRMVQNACHRMRRGRKNDPHLHAEMDAETPSNSEDSPEAAAVRGEMAVALGEALLELDARDRTLLLLGDGEDWRGPELAEKLGMTETAVRTRLSRLRKRLRDDLGPLWSELG